MDSNLNNIAFKDILHGTDNLFNEVMSEKNFNSESLSFTEVILHDELEFSIDEIRQIIDEEIFE